MKFAKHWAGALDDYVIDLAWSPDGALLAAASQGGGITLFDAATGTVKHTLPGHTNGANCLAWDSSGGQIVSGGQDGKVKFWDRIGSQTSELKLGAAWIDSIVSGGGHFAAAMFAACGRKIFAFTSDGAVAHEFPDAPKTIAALSLGVSTIGSDSSACLAAAHFGGVRLFSANSFKLLKEYTYGNALLALTWSPDGRWLVAGCHDNAVHLWAPAEDLELHMSGYETKLRELSFSHDSKWLATGGGRDACVWDCSGPGPEGREPLLLPHKAPVRAVAFQNKHSLLATGASDGEFALWGPTRASPLLVEVRMPAAPTKFAWRHDDTQLAVGTEQGHVFVFKTD